MSQSFSRPLRVRVLIALLVTAWLLSPITVFAKSIGKQNLLDLMSHSESILVGTVSELSDGFHRGLPYTEVTVTVGQSLKGDHGKTYSFRQFGLTEPKAMGDGRVNLMVTPAGWPTWVEGEQVLLFLHAPASETGFRTTAGLDQGKFAIRGNRIANSLDNEALFSGLAFNGKLTPGQSDLVKQPGGAYAAQEFLSLVRTIVEEQWIENGVMIHEK